MPLMRLSVSPARAEGDAGDGDGGAGTAKPAVSADVGAVFVGYVAVVAGAAVGIFLWKWRDPSSFTPGSGISVFAPLYILAQAIERFLEPFSGFLSSVAPDGGASGAKSKKATAMENVHLALARSNVQEAAQWQRVVDRIRRNTAVIAWGLASFVGMALCGLFGLFMLRLIGFTGVPKEVDIVISGLAIGSGTKPLHDLISNLQQSKEQKEDPPEKQAA